MIDRLRRVLTLMTDPRVAKLPRLLVLGAVVYTIIPTDFVPDVPIIGWLDDLTFLWLSLRWLVRSAASTAAIQTTSTTVERS